MGAAAPFLITAGTQLALGATFAAALQVAMVTFVISRAAAALQKRPEAAADDGGGRTRTFRQEASPRIIVYGEARTGGIITYAESTHSNRYLHLVITLTGHEVEAIREVYFDDEIAVDAAGNLASKWRGFRTSGDIIVDGATNRYIADRTAASPADFFDVEIGQLIEVSGFANAANNGVKRVTSAVIDTVNNQHRITVAESLATEAETSASMQGDWAHVSKHLGADDQAADDQLVQVSSKWTADHRQRGCAYLYVRLRWNRDKWPTGIPNISAVVRGKNDIFDPRDGLTKYTANAALCTADYLVTPRYGFGADYATEISEDELIDAANVCDEQVGLAGGGTEARYTINGTLSSAAEPIANLEQMIGAMAGDAIWSGGQWYVQAGAYRTPTLTLDEDDARGPLEITTAVSRRALFNRVKGTFVGPVNDYVQSSFPAVTNATYQAEDNGEAIWQDLALPLTDSAARSQRIAKIELERVRQQISVGYPCSLKALQVRAGDTVMVSNARMGWTDKVFEVVDWQFAVDAESDNPTLGVDLTLRETAAAVYDWNSGEETTVDPAPDTDLPDPFTVAPPQNVQVASGTDHLYPKKDGTIVSRIRVSWTASDDSFVREYEVQAKRSIDAEWEPAARADGEVRQAYVWDVEDDVAYDVRVRAINQLGVRSAWAPDDNGLQHTVVGKTAPPANVERLFVVQNGESVILRWRPVPDADIAGYELRYALRDRASWSNSIRISEVERGTAVTEADIPPGDWRFLIKAIDTSGNYSAQATAADLVVGTNYTDLFRTDHHPDWTTGRAVGFDIQGDSLQPNNEEVAYYISDVVDVGFDAEKLRVWSQVDVATSPVDSTSDYGAVTEGVTATTDYGSIGDAVTATQDWGSLLLGLSTSDALVTYEIAYRNDADPWADASAVIVDYGAITEAVTKNTDYGLITEPVDQRTDRDTLMSWQEWTKGEIDARYIKQRVRIASDVPDEPLRILRRFTTVVDVPERTERHNGLSVSVGGSTFSFDRRFHALPNVVGNVESDNALFPVRKVLDEESVTYVVRDATGADVGAPNFEFTATGI